MRMPVKTIGCVTALTLALCQTVAAQELEPGLYLNAPPDFNVFAVSYGLSTGNVLVDAALPIDGAKARIHLVGLGYVRTLDLGGRAAKLDVQVPVSWGTFEGTVNGTFLTRSVSGIADPRVRLSVNLFGSPALTAERFAAYQQHTIIGTSLQVALPLGQYDEARLINLGAHRWSFRPEAAVSHRRGRWLLELAAGAWLFTENDDHFGGHSLAQQALYFLKGSAIYTFRRNLWVAANYGRATGGETSIDGAHRNDLQRNDRAGLTLGMPAGRATMLKVTYTSGLATRLGSDFDSLGVAYQYTWR